MASAVCRPAFETYGPPTKAAAYADFLASKSKAFLAEGIRQNRTGPFDARRFPPGHNWTLFDRWFVAHDPYKVPYGSGCVGV